MSEDHKIPPPDIKTVPPVTPPVTTVDAESPKKEEPKKEEAKETESEPDSSNKAGDVETDLVKRFLGAFIDAIVATAAGHLISMITGSWILSTAATSMVWLVRDSLPFLEGQSLGKKVMKTKAVKEDGSPLTGDWATGAIRNVLLAIPFAGLVECVVILIRQDKPEKGLRLGDQWAKTKVISVD